MIESRRAPVIWTLAGLAVLLLLYFLSGMLTPFVAGLVVAYLLDPIADRLERLGLPRGLASGTLLFSFFAALTLVIVLLYPPVQSQVTGFLHRLPDLIDRAREWLLPYVQNLVNQVMPNASGTENVRGAVTDSASKAVSLAGQLLGGFLGGGLALVNILSLLVITPVVAFYMLRDYDRMVALIDSWLPRQSAPIIREQVREVDRVLSGFIRGQATVCLVMGVFYSVGLTSVGLEFGLLIGLATGLLTFIPYIGMTIGVAAGAAVALVQFGTDYSQLALVGGVFLLGNILEGAVISPKLVGDKVGLHPVWIIFALLAFGSLFGFVGILLAVPVAAVLGVVARFLLTRYLASPLYHGRTP